MAPARRPVTMLNISEISSTETGSSKSRFSGLLSPMLTPKGSKVSTPRSATKSGRSIAYFDHKFETKNYFEMCKHMRNSMDVRNRYVGFTLYEKCVLASEIVQWLLNHRECENVEEAEYLGSQLEENGHIYDLSGEKKRASAPSFKNRSIPFRFCLDDRNMSGLLSKSEYETLTKCFNEEIEGKTVKVGKHMISNVVTGEQVTLWITEKGFGANRAEALAIADRMLQDGTIYYAHGSGAKSFQDGADLYAVRDVSRTEATKTFTPRTPTRKPRTPRAFSRHASDRELKKADYAQKPVLFERSGTNEKRVQIDSQCLTPRGSQNLRTSFDRGESFGSEFSRSLTGKSTQSSSNTTQQSALPSPSSEGEHKNVHESQSRRPSVRSVDMSLFAPRRLSAQTGSSVTPSPTIEMTRLSPLARFSRDFQE